MKLAEYYLVNKLNCSDEMCQYVTLKFVQTKCDIEICTDEM
jgi:hypothetical protein